MMRTIIVMVMTNLCTSVKKNLVAFFDVFLVFKMTLNLMQSIQKMMRKEMEMVLGMLGKIYVGAASKPAQAQTGGFRTRPYD
jgi:hypothetical protein